MCIFVTSYLANVAQLPIAKNKNLTINQAFSLPWTEDG